MNYVLFHDDSDGYASALAAKLTHAWKDAIYISVQYGQSFPSQVPLVPTTKILIVDFSYKREILEDIYAKVESLLVIDHHKTAQEDLKDLPYAVFDMEESGATLTWKYFHDDAVPDLFKFVGDRDLWRFQYPESRWLEHGINASGRAKDLTYWEQLFEFPGALEQTLTVGKVLQENVDGICKSFVKAGKYATRTLPDLFRIDKPVKFALFNNTTLISEMSEAVYKADDSLDFVMSYFILPTTAEVVFSLRAAKNKTLDMGQLAKCFGGGGHPKAAGFKLPYDQAALFIVPDYDGSFPSEGLEAARKFFADQP